jgi:hypothetical protein
MAETQNYKDFWSTHSLAMGLHIILVLSNAYFTLYKHSNKIY